MGVQSPSALPSVVKSPLRTLSYKLFGHKGRQHLPMCLTGIHSSKSDNH